MRSRIRRLSGDALVSAGVVGVVLITLMSIDIRVREQVSTVIGSPSQVRDAGSQLGDLGAVLFEAARTQSIDHAPMMILVAAGTVLLLFMVRS